MAVTELGHVTASAFLGGPVTLTLSATPSGTDVVEVSVVNSGSGACTVSGLTGATWTKMYGSPDTNQIIQVWKATGATSAGTITVSQGGGNNTQAKARIIRGLGSANHSVQSATADASGAGQVGPAISAGNGQWVLAFGESNKLTAFSGGAPASGWTNDALAGTAGDATKFGRSTRIPTSSATHSALYTNSDTASNGRMVIVTLGDEILPPSAPTNLSEIHSFTTATIDWDAGTGDLSSYEYRVDGGSVTDIGNVLTVDLTSLTPGTTYLFEVRSVGPGGSSAWASIEFATDPLIPIAWSTGPEDRFFHHGVDRGVLYPSVGNAVAWNGILGVDEASDSKSSIYYIDGRIYMADVDPGDFSGSLMTYDWPEAFSACIGIPAAAEGLYVDNQKPKRFGLSYRSLIGSGTDGDMFGYQIHLVYQAMAQISTRNRKTINASPAPMEFQFDLVATPVTLPGFRPSAHFIIDTRNLTPEVVAQLEEILYGGSTANARLPEPVELYDLLNFGSAITFTTFVHPTLGLCWTAEGAVGNVHMTSATTWEILNVNGTDHMDGTYTLEDTP